MNVVVLSAAVDVVMHAASVLPAVGQAMRIERWWLAIALGGNLSVRTYPG